MDQAGGRWPDGVDHPAAALTHWSFTSPFGRRSGGGTPSWARNPIDAFVLAKLEKAKLEPSPEADRYTLIRRREPRPDRPAAHAGTRSEAFVDDTAPDAYEKLVDRLHGQPALSASDGRGMWLDLRATPTRPATAPTRCARPSSAIATG